jgi:hypothetical protein
MTPGHIRLHALIEELASAYRGYLPDALKIGEFTSTNSAIPPDIRTRLALIEDTVAKADRAVDDPLLNAAPALYQALHNLVDFIHSYGIYDRNGRSMWEDLGGLNEPLQALKKARGEK